MIAPDSVTVFRIGDFLCVADPDAEGPVAPRMAATIQVATVLVNPIDGSTDTAVCPSVPCLIDTDAPEDADDVETVP